MVLNLGARDMTSTRLAAACVAALALSWASAAAAEPGLGQKVYDPYVRNGLSEVEVRTGRLIGGTAEGDQTTVVELERGINDRFSLAVLGEIEDEPGDARKLDAIAVEGVMYLGQIPHLGIDTGLYLEYEQRIHNQSGVLEGKLLLAKTQNRFQGLFNIIAGQALTDRDGAGATEFSYAASATWETAPKLRVGVEAFGDLGTSRSFGGRQAHYVGPVVKWETRPSWLPAELELEAGYLFAAGGAKDYTDGQLRVLIALERRF